MLKIKRGDTVQVIKGKDSGKKGKVLFLSHESGRALVEGINLVKKHKRQTKQDQQGGIVSIEAPLNIGNIMLFCPGCNHPVRVGFTVLKDKTKTRFCKSCKVSI